MRTYQFANIAARAYPNMSDINNRWIFMPDTVVVVNVSPKYKKEIVDAIKSKDIDYYHFPLEEETNDIGWGNIQKAVEVLLRYDKTGKHMIVHCDCGNHRSRLVVEAFHFAKLGCHFIDEYKGYDNHLIYDCNSSYLLSLKIVEETLFRMNKGRL